MRIKFLLYCFVHKILLSLLFVDVQQRCLPWSELAAPTNVNWEKAVEDKQRCEKTDSYGLQKQKHAIHTCLCACLVCTLTEHWLYCMPGDTTWSWGSWVILVVGQHAGYHAGEQPMALVYAWWHCSRCETALWSGLCQQQVFLVRFCSELCFKLHGSVVGKRMGRHSLCPVYH